LPQESLGSRLLLDQVCDMIQLPAFPRLVQIVLAGTFLTRTSFFMVWPFLAVILLRDFHLPPAEIGLILGGSAMSSSVMGFYLGNLSDRFGRRNIMVTGCVGSVAAFFILGAAHTVLLYSLGAVLVGLCRSAIESPASALVSDSIKEQATRELAFHVRYFLINVGAAVGPFIGFSFGLATQQTTFWITGLAYFLFAVALVAGFRRKPETLPPNANEEAHLSTAVRALNNDRGFLMLVFASFLACVAYSQVESTLVQYLNLDGRGVGVGLVTAIITTNALTIITFQFPLLRLLRPYDLYIRIYIGMALFVLGCCREFQH
jgi:MFS family permease